MISRLLLWLAFLALTPAGPELEEWIAHYVQEGDFANEPNHSCVPRQDSERGCAVLSHSCSCHGPTAPVREIGRVARQARLPLKRSWALLALVVAQTEPEPATPPPIT